MVILKTRNKINDFLMILAWAGPLSIDDIALMLMLFLAVV